MGAVANSNDPISATLRAHLRDPRSGFSIGALGAIAEFHRDPGEPVEIGGPRSLRVETERGAIRLDVPTGVRPLAYEAPSRRPVRWQQGVVFCLAASRVPKRRPTVLTEHGLDRDPVRERDRDGILFDLGLGLRNAEFCIRTADPHLVRILRQAAGRPIFAPGNSIMAELVAASPTRVVRSELGRIEVYQPIDLTATPGGPHTHLLPELLRAKRTHAANVPVPPGWIPCLSLHPPDPLSEGEGGRLACDRRLFAAFQRLLSAWGNREYTAEKARFSAAIAAGRDPARYRPPAGRWGRMAVNVTLRQLRQADPDCPNLARWSRRLGRAA